MDLKRNDRGVKKNPGRGNEGLNLDYYYTEKNVKQWISILVAI